MIVRHGNIEKRNPSHPRIQFNLRALFALTTVSAICFSLAMLVGADWGAGIAFCIGGVLYWLTHLKYDASYAVAYLVMLGTGFACLALIGS